jgi:dTDP-glucose 4,6-dehydratase
MTVHIVSPKDLRPASYYHNGKAERTILVTGAAGFIGSNFARYVFQKYPHYKIVAYDALTYAGNVDNFTVEMRESDRFEFVYGNVCNSAQVAEVMRYVDTVVHFAAETHVTRSIYDSQTFFETDVLGTSNLANAAVRHLDYIERFIHISTSEVYGTCRDDHELMDEEHPLEPCSPYASAKAGADRLIYSYWRTYGLPTVIVRPFNNFGPHQHLEKVVPRFVTSAILGEPLTVHGTGFSARDWLYVSDTCEALDALLHAPVETVRGETFNLGTGIDTDVLTLAKKVLALTGRDESLIEWIGDRPGQVAKHRANIEKMKRVLGWAPSIALDEGLARTIEWYRDNEDFWRRQLWMRKIRISTTAGREWH